MLKLAGKLSLGALAAQCITFLAIPLISRIYSPHEYGIFAAIVSLAAILTPIATLKIETAIVTTQDPTDTSNLLRLCLVSMASIATLLTLTLLIVEAVSIIFHNKSINITWFILPVVLISNSLAILGTQIAIKEKAYSKFNRSSLLQNSIIASAQLILGKLSPSSILLVSGLVLGKTFSFIYFFKEFKSNILPKQNKFNNLRENFSKKLGFIKFLIAGNILEAFASALPLIVLVTLYSRSKAGIFSMTQLVISAPIILIGSGIGSILLAEIKPLKAYKDNQNNTHVQLVRRMILFLTSAALIYLLTSLLFANSILQIVLGPKWQPELTDLVPYLVWSNAITLVWYPLVNLFWARNEWRYYFGFTFVRSILMVVAAILCHFFRADWQLFLFYVLTAGSLGQIFGLFILKYKVRW